VIHRAVEASRQNFSSYLQISFFTTIPKYDNYAWTGFTWKLFPSLLFYGGGFGGQESGTSKE